MAWRLLVAAALLAALRIALEPSRETSAAGEALRLLLLGFLAWVIAGWTAAPRPLLEAFPLELPAARAAALAGATLLLAAAAFGHARGLSGLRAAGLFAAAASAAGWCASRWPQLSRAVELCGAAFAGPLLWYAAVPALGATAWLAAAAALEPRDRAPRRALAGVLALWAALTFGAETVLTRAYGFGPRSLAEAARVPTNAASRVAAVAFLAPERGRAFRVETRRLSSETTDLSAASADRLEDFLAETDYKGVFAAEAMKAVRDGWLQLWDEERALDALALSIPGRVHPDYKRALELVRAGPLTPGRFEKLERLAAATGRRVEGFESANGAQEIFEGFSSAYARFGDEVEARKWLQRIDGLWGVSDKRIEAGSLEDMRDGRVAGAVMLSGRPAESIRVGLFLVPTSTSGVAGKWLLSAAQLPDERGLFVFEDLGPGIYGVALMGRPEDLRGEILGIPGLFEVGYDDPYVTLRPIRVEPGLTPRDAEPASPAAPSASVPAAVEPPPIRFRR